MEAAPVSVPPTPAANYAIGGTTSGLKGSGLVLQNNAGDDLAIASDGTFRFAAPMNDGQTYLASVKTAPTNPTQTCSVGNAGGSVRGGGALVTVKAPPVGHACTVAHRPAPVTANVTDVQVICSPFPLTVGGDITGMIGTGLVLRNNGVDDLVLLANGSFTFAKPVAYGAPYVVSVAAQPSFSQCAVSNGSATATANVTNVSIACTPEALQVTTLAGSGTMATIDGAGTAASFNRPYGIASDVAGNLYVAQSGDGALRKISPSGDVTTLTSWGSASVRVAVSPSGDIFVLSSGLSQILKVSPSGDASPFAGSGMTGSVDGSAASATFNGLSGMAFDSRGSLYVSERYGNRIRRVRPNGEVTTLAGSGERGAVDGSGAAATFDDPFDIAVGPDDNVYVAELGGNKIRKITAAGVVTTLAGSGFSGSADGIGTAATFFGPAGIAVDAAGAVYVTDHLNHKIRQIDPSGAVTTLAGTGARGSTNSAASTATFNYPIAVLVDAQGNLVVADRSNNLIRKISR